MSTLKQYCLLIYNVSTTPTVLSTPVQIKHLISQLSKCIMAILLLNNIFEANKKVNYCKKVNIVCYYFLIRQAFVKSILHISGIKTRQENKLQKMCDVKFFVSEESYAMSGPTSM